MEHATRSALVLTVLGLLCVFARASDKPAPKKVLVYTVSAGFEHDVVKRPTPDALSLVEQTLVDMGRSTGAFEAVATRDAAEFEPQKLASYALVFFYTTRELPLSDTQRGALFEFVRRGGGFAGVHSATDTFYDVPAYGEMIGAYFDGHPWHQNIRVTVEDRAHASTRHLGASFEIIDEIYQFRAPYDRANLHVLMSLDTSSIDLKVDGVHRTDGDFALAWTKSFGDGRVFYTALGHRPELWRDERYLKHVLGGLRWAMRAPIGVALKPADEEYRKFALENPGDPARGHALFRRESGPMCVRCHKANGTGGVIGPDLSGTAKAHSREEILEAILAPSASIEPGYEATSLELADETIAFGRVVKQSADEIALADTAGQLRVIAPKNVVRRSASSVSVMPEGLASTLSKPEFADLVAYVLTLTVPPAR